MAQTRCLAAGYLIGDALVAERTQQPFEYLGRVTISNGLKDTGFPSISADVIKKCQRTGQTADPSDQLRRMVILFGVITEGSTKLSGPGPSRSMG
jgi:hypothetical protein